MRAAATRIAGSTFGSATDLTLEFDITRSSEENGKSYSLVDDKDLEKTKNKLQKILDILDES